ncbi:MAG: hypothetical protein J6J23_01680, partial [Clostridia bacterium]|nr:hypothetical protein [Clostridia bacterium]
MKETFKFIFAFLGAVLFFGLLHLAKLGEFISPFAVACIFAVFCIEKHKAWLLFSYFISGILTHLTPLGIIEIVLQVMLIFGLALIKKFLKPKLFSLVYGVGMVISEIPVIFFYGLNDIILVNYIISIILSVLFYYLFIRLFCAIKNRGVKEKFAIDELFGVFILIVGISLGAFVIRVDSINMSLIITLFALIILSNLTSVYPLLFVAVSSGLSFMLAYNQYNYFVIFLFWALIIITFKNSYKIIMAVMIIICDVLLGLVFKVYDNYSLINFLLVAILGCVYICLPKNINRGIRSKLEFIRPASGQLEELFRKSVNNKLSSFIGLLYDIDSIYKDMVVPISDFNKSKSEF